VKEREGPFPTSTFTHWKWYKEGKKRKKGRGTISLRIAEHNWKGRRRGDPKKRRKKEGRRFSCLV